ncbi:Uncharacterized protein K02A2.6 [Exaiptasia diaphana]|nr:Uncharacterized protein K02A2.6 [Exaiptasia diaphana]
MKEIARNYIWWSKLDQDIEAVDSSCAPCPLTKNSPQSQRHLWYITTAPYHPASNGQAERYFQTFKQAYRAGHGSLSQKMPNFLLQYRHSPNGTTRCSQAQLMFGRPLRTRLDLISPNDAFQRKRNDQALHLSIAIQIVS